MTVSRTGSMASSLALLAVVAVIAGAQTKPPAKKPAAPATAHAMVLESGSEQWGEVPAAALMGTASVEMGGTLRLAIIQGDPMTAGRSYTLRLSCTDGTKIAPHWHPTTENVTVIKGGAAVGMGSKWDDAAMKDVPAGGFFSAAPKMRHFAQCKGESVLQVHGIAPFVINFVAPDEAAPARQ
jgi:oxalate decarboxylase/phosphoglucose isomerase-like protein (cupin superfamily)